MFREAMDEAAAESVVMVKEIDAAMNLAIGHPGDLPTGVGGAPVNESAQRGIGGALVIGGEEEGTATGPKGNGGGGIGLLKKVRYFGVALGKSVGE